MNVKSFARASLLAVFGFAAIAAQAATAPMNNDGAMQYHYGDHLDIKKVLSVKDDQSNACGVVNTRLNYLDSKGQHESVEYRTYATGGCHDN
ncbi:DUF2790 domain-containing protein [Pseudomonas plecoglossicida]|uniref:DUF2790 domain-containing protein n=1 Tax=Pseudomonas plecoglossicida TaxID=70775 RepID=A0AAD0VSH7_PSEDL|nr:DUF2790 domain-containing protein [Pseudomonas plecoglossicida]AXM95145.1 DUF2790 domain-containing protein [Pseudomonas plecoglossicida]EPB96980.1 hypothetical protein L321_05392 [Pseudomonas plecoglossicida NB2011]QLB55893.1 DUF2790 domain-containing protein [Pseudomonas plecoglossicida]GLR35507.1 hypothetical protein GCM10011247_09040 [Pseudomonas plecoglossicida]